MKKTTYKEGISKSEQQTQAEDLEYVVQEAKSHVELSIVKTRGLVSKAKQAYERSKFANPYDLQTEINAKAEVEKLEAGLKYAEEVLAERFPAEEAKEEVK